MREKDIVPQKGIEIIKGSQDRRVAVSQEGFEIRREGKPIDFEAPSIGFVYLVVDCSGSMSEGSKLDQAKEGALNFAKDAGNKGYLTGLIKFESSATHLCEPIRDILVLEKHLQSLHIGGSTNMSDAIRMSNQHLKNKEGLRVIVIATDGMPDSQASTLHEAQQAKNNGIDIIAIGTDDTDRDFLRRLASRTDLSAKVERRQFGKSISTAVKMLPQLKSGKGNN